MAKRVSNSKVCPVCFKVLSARGFRGHCAWAHNELTIEKAFAEGEANMENTEQHSQSNPGAPKLELPPELKQLCEQTPLICEKLDELCELQGEVAEFLAGRFMEVLSQLKS